MPNPFFQLDSSFPFTSHVALKPAANPIESTSKVFSHSCPYLVQDTTFSYLDSLISFQSDFIIFIPALVLNLNTTVQMCHLKGKPDHATLLHLTRQKIRSPNNGLQGTPPSGPIPPSLSALLPTTLPLAHSVLNSKAHSCFKEFAFVFPSARNVLPPDAAGRAPSLLSGSTPTLPSHSSLPRGPSVLHPNQVYAAHTIKGLFFQAETET